MTPFQDAEYLLEHCQRELPQLEALHSVCLTNRSVSAEFLVEVKNFVENLRSALDYAAVSLFNRFGHSDKSKPIVYFPIATAGVDRQKFRNKVVDQKIPGISDARPDIVDLLESYQYFGNSGNWLSMFSEIVNDNKHNRLIPQFQKQYQVVEFKVTVPAGETVMIDLQNIQLGAGANDPIQARAGIWTGLVFEGTETWVLPFLGVLLIQVRRVVDELSRATLTTTDLSRGGIPRHNTGV